MKETFCSEASRRAGEGIAGSAVAGITKWILLEHRQPWADKAYEKSTLPAKTRAHLDGVLARMGQAARLQFLRRDGSASGPLTLFLANTEPGACWVRRVDVDAEQVSSVDIEAIFSGELEMGERIDHPLYFVCTHGKRDRCCALHGRKLFAALHAERGDAVWQSSHLGGHRFAPTLLTLPFGLLYGRLDPEDAAELVKASEAGRFHRLTTLRGRSAYPPEVQAAESAVLGELAVAERAIDALRLLRQDAQESGAWTVVFGVGRSERSVSVVLEELEGLRPKSCGKLETNALRFRVR